MKETGRSDLEKLDTHTLSLEYQVLARDLKDAVNITDNVVEQTKTKVKNKKANLVRVSLIKDKVLKLGEVGESGS